MLHCGLIISGITSVIMKEIRDTRALCWREFKETEWKCDAIHSWFSISSTRFSVHNIYQESHFWATWEIKSESQIRPPTYQ